MAVNLVKQIPIILAVVLVLLTWLPPSYSFIKKHVASPRTEDVPHIKCQVCEKIAFQLHELVQKKQAKISPRKITELEIIEIAENVCNLKKEEADWIMKIDIVEKGDKLELVGQDDEGQCNSECKTIELACQEVMGYADTDVAEYIYAKKPQVVSLVDYFCKDLTSACSVKPPPVPKDRTPGEPFVPKSSSEAELRRSMRSMQGVPGSLGMEMYTTEELMKSLRKDDDDDDNPSKWGEVLGKRNSNTGKQEL